MTVEVAKNVLQIIVPTKDLLHALNFSSSIVEKRNVVNELNNIKLTAHGNNLTIGSTDIDIYLNQTIGAEVIKEGVTTVAFQTFSDIIRKIADSEIKLIQEQGSDKIEIIGKNCRFELLTLTAAKFPVLEKVEAEIEITVPCKELSRILEYTAFSMSTEETRYNLNGVYLHTSDKELRSAATDGHRLSVSTCTLDSHADNFGVIIPRKTVTELIKIIKDPKNINNAISITLGSNKIKFEMQNILLISKLIDGTFPDYSSFIPVDNDSCLTINTKLLASSVDRVGTVTVEKFKAIKLSIDDELVRITASGESKGVGAEKLLYSDKSDIFCQYQGTHLSIGFNPSYISDVLSHVKEERVEIFLKDNQSPILIKIPENPSDSFVVMPVKA